MFLILVSFLSCVAVISLGLKNHALMLQVEKNLEELKQSAEEKVAAVRKAEEGASDLKKRVEELSMSLEEHEKEYQVSIQNFMGIAAQCISNPIISQSDDLHSLVGCAGW